MKKSKKQSRKKTIIYFLDRAKYYNNAGKYDKAVEKIKIAYSLWKVTRIGNLRKLKRC